MAATVSSFVLCPYGLWPTSNLFRIWEVPIFSLGLKAGCLDRRSVFFVFDVQADAGWCFKMSSECCHILADSYAIKSFDAVTLGLTRSRQRHKESASTISLLSDVPLRSIPNLNL